MWHVAWGVEDEARAPACSLEGCWHSVMSGRLALVQSMQCVVPGHLEVGRC